MLQKNNGGKQPTHVRLPSAANVGVRATGAAAAGAGGEEERALPWPVADDSLDSFDALIAFAFSCRRDAHN
jgi:hypothetical protein